MKNLILLLVFISAPMSAEEGPKPARTLLRNATLIDGLGTPARPGTDLLLEGDRIAEIGTNLRAPGAKVLDLAGKTVIPGIVCAHAHVGILKGTATRKENYTRENVLAQLKRYQQYGIGAVLSLGTDRPLIFGGLRDSSSAGLLEGARLFSAGYGFGVKNGAPPPQNGMDQVFRPGSADEAGEQVRSLLPLRPTALKMWVDDFGGSAPKMPEEIYTAIIREAGRYGVKTASHVYNLEDARKLVDAGLKIIAHSIRDREIDDALLAKMKQNGVVYIPTLTLDEFSFCYADSPSWLPSPFFRASLEPGVYEMLTAQSYRDNVRNSAGFARNRKGFEVAMKNVKRVYDAGIPVALGTDSGATPARAQGFSEHREMELLVKAGIPPVRVIRMATQEAAKLLGIDQNYGTLEKGKKADFVVLGKNPENDITNTQTIVSVWKDGVEVSKGPLEN